MAKDNKNKAKNLFREKMSKIEKIRKDTEKELKKIVVDCAHQNEKGKLKIHPVGNPADGNYECKYCKTRFNMNPIKDAELDTAIEIVHDAIQQIRCFSDYREDEKLIRLLGELDFNMQETKELYTRAISVYGRGNGKKKDKKNRNNDSDFGNYGSGPISFISGGRRR